MRNYLYKNRLALVLEMAKNQSLGQSDLAAKKLKCSSRSIKKYISQLRKEGHPIVYDRTLKRYVMEE